MCSRTDLYYLTGALAVVNPPASGALLPTVTVTVTNNYKITFLQLLKATH